MMRTWELAPQNQCIFSMPCVMGDPFVDPPMACVKGTKNNHIRNRKNRLPHWWPDSSNDSTHMVSRKTAYPHGVNFCVNNEAAVLTFAVMRGGGGIS